VGTKPIARHAQFGRLAIRAEGNFVNAYYAMPDTMKGATLLFSVNRSAALRPGVHEKILDLGRQIVGEIVFEISGVRPLWGGPEAAPEHERAGHG
jgi:hypothetical protein